MDKNKLESSQVYPDRFGWSEGFRNDETDVNKVRCLECNDELTNIDNEYCDKCWEMLHGRG